MYSWTQKGNQGEGGNWDRQDSHYTRGANTYWKPFNWEPGLGCLTGKTSFPSIDFRSLERRRMNSHLIKNWVPLTNILGTASCSSTNIVPSTKCRSHKKIDGKLLRKFEVAVVHLLHAPPPHPPTVHWIQDNFVFGQNSKSLLVFRNGPVRSFGIFYATFEKTKWGFWFQVWKKLILKTEKMRKWLKTANFGHILVFLSD